MSSKVQLSILLAAVAAVAAFLWLQPSRGAAPAPGAHDALHDAADGHGHGLAAPLEPAGGAGGAGRADVGAWDGGASAAAAPAALEDGVRGRVLDENGAPIEGARVVVSDHPSLPLDFARGSTAAFLRRFAATSDADGVFRVAGPAPGAPLCVSARASGYAPFSADAVAAPRTGAELEPIVLQRGAILVGIVLDADGRPVGGARLTVLDPAAPARLPDGPRSADAHTRDDGRFRLDELACGPWRILVSAERHPARVFDGVAGVPGAEVADLELRLGRGAPLAGRVLGAPESEIGSLQVIARLAPVPGAAPEPSEPRAARVERDGRFQLAGLEPEREYDVQAFDDSGYEPENALVGHAPRSAVVRARAGELAVVLRWSAGASLSFRVLDARTRAPLTEFGVRSRSSPDEELAAPSGAGSRTHPDGRARIDGLGLGSAPSLELAIDAPGYESFQATVALAPDAETDLGEILLAPSAAVIVRVADAASSAPLAGARAWLLREEPGAPRGGLRVLLAAARHREGEGADGYVPQGIATARSGADGVATLPSREGETCTLRVEAEGYGAYEVAGLSLPRGRVVEHEARLEREGRVAVLVLDAAGAPLEGVEIDHVAPEERDEPYVPLPPGLGERVRTGPDGRVTIGGLGAGLHRVRVDERRALARTAPGGRGGVQEGRLVLPSDPDWRDVRVAAGETSELEIRVAARASVVGKVSEDGAALAGATVSLEHVREGADAPAGFETHPPAALRTRTSGRGEYRLSELSAGRYRVRVEHATRAMPAELEVELAPGENALDIALDVATIRGRVTTAEGAPLEGVSVRARAAGEPADELAHAGPDAAGARTDADGRYALRGVAPGVELVVVAAGGGFQEARSRPLSVGAGREREGVDLALERGGALEIGVRLASGAPASAGLVRATFAGAEGAEPRVALVRSGVAVLEGCKPGRWSLRVVRVLGEDGNPLEAGAAPREVDVVAGQTARVTLEL
jgi:protocatechuate 3,4-dioxygenase beta subunit